MRRTTRSKTDLLWFALVAAAFFAISLSGDVERATSPSAFGLHVLLRKIYSIGAFAVVAFLLARLRRSQRRDVPAVALMVAGYSAAIEAAQAALGSHEGVIWNAADTLCGLLGGFMGGSAYALFQRRLLRVARADQTAGETAGGLENGAVERGDHTRGNVHHLL